MVEVSICIPYHEREGSRKNLLQKTLPALQDQGEYSINLPESFSWCEPSDRWWRFTNSKESVEVLLIFDSAVPPIGRNNVCLRTNVGLKLARGEYFILLDQDFQLQPNAIPSAIDYLELDSNYIIYPTAFKEMSVADHNPVLWMSSWGCVGSGESGFFIAALKDNLIEIGGWDEKYAGFWGFEDLNFLLRLKMKYTVIYAPTVCGLHVWHPPVDPQKIGGINGALLDEFKKNPQIVANVGYEWGILYDGKE